MFYKKKTSNGHCYSWMEWPIWKTAGPLTSVLLRKSVGHILGWWTGHFCFSEDWMNWTLQLLPTWIFWSSLYWKSIVWCINYYIYSFDKYKCPLILNVSHITETLSRRTYLQMLIQGWREAKREWLQSGLPNSKLAVL